MGKVRTIKVLRLVKIRVSNHRRLLKGNLSEPSRLIRWMITYTMRTPQLNAADKMLVYLRMSKDLNSKK